MGDRPKPTVMKLQLVCCTLATVNIQYDRFSRTTASNHEAIVKEFFQRVWDAGDIYQGQQQGWYCVSCEEFKEERTPRGTPLRHPHKQASGVARRAELLFRLSRYRQLEAPTRTTGFYSARKSPQRSFELCQAGTARLFIGELRLGFPVPVNQNHTLYVWFDALLGYVTALFDRIANPPWKMLSRGGRLTT